MKKIECIIRSEKLKDLEAALRLIGIGGMTATEVKGFGTQTTRPESYLFLPKTKIEIYARDGQVKDVLEAVTRVCRSGKLGDGKVVVLPINDAMRVRTGERREKALC